MIKVSIVIPTRNRSHLLVYALRSALQQTHQDIEVVICDNASRDNTAELASQFLNDDRVKYVRTDKPLSMPDNWDYALAHATGDFITYLTDDSVLFPTTIEYVLNEMTRTEQCVAVWRHAAYYYSDWYEKSRRNVLYIPRTENNSEVQNSEEMLRRLYDMDCSIWVDIPKTLNSICHRDVVSSVLRRQGRFFAPSCPDYSSAASVLLNTRTYLFIDKALYIDSVTKASIGASTGYDMGEASKNFFSEFQEGMDEIALIGIPVSPSGVAKSIENVAQSYPERDLRINYENLIHQVADRLAKVESNGGDVRKYWQLLETYTCNDHVLRKVFRQTRKISGIKWWIVNLARRSSAIAFLERIRGFDVYEGRKAGFKDIEEAAKFANTVLFGR